MTALVAAPAITLTRSINATAEQVYKSFTDREWIRDWFCDDAFIRTAEGGHVTLFFYPNRHATGQFDGLEANQQVALTLRFSGYEADTHLDVALQEQAGVTDVSLTLSGAVDEAMEEMWADGLRRLQIALETGADARVTERVLIGIYPGEFNAEIAQKLNVPVTQGTLVNDVIPGLGAQKAGLQTNDVVVEIDGVAVTDDMPIFQIVRVKRPGDSVTVGYYRNGEKQTSQMPLSGYPMPNFPADFTGLADQLEQINAGLDKELGEVFNGVSESEAAAKPAPKEWSANDVLAHLILSERYRQQWIGGMIDAPEPTGWSGNSDARIASVVGSYKTSQALIAELRRSWAESVLLIRSMPEINQKSVLWWMTFELGGAPNHTQQHLKQIREAIAAARK
jgi:uncharacterized protein YndB with AHSA1/START domain